MIGGFRGAEYDDVRVIVTLTLMMTGWNGTGRDVYMPEFDEVAACIDETRNYLNKFTKDADTL